MNSIVHEIRSVLEAQGDAAVRAGTKRFFKEEIRCYGLKTPAVTALAKTLFKAHKDAPKAELFAVCEELWRSGYMEESFIACNWAYALRRRYTPDDFAIFERWVSDYVSNWAACDTLCTHTIGTFMESYPAFLPELSRWAASPNRWLRRAAAVTLIVPAKRGLFLAEAFAVADRLLCDSDDLVQKGYGWLLKAASQAREEEVFEFVMARRATMPRTALRYAIEKMSPSCKARAMRK